MAQTPQPESPTFDYIIVGAGTAGCLLANRLSADPAKRVLLLEAGGRDDYHWIHIPVGYLYCIGNPRTDWLFKTEPDAGLNGRSLRYPRGKTLGGCSSINGMIYMRGQSRDYERWADLTGDDAWRWPNVLQAFRRHEDHWLGADDLRTLRVLADPLRYRMLDLLARPRSVRELAAALGRPPDRLYYHLNRLHVAGLVEPAGAQRWRAVDRRLRIDPAGPDGGNCTDRVCGRNAGCCRCSKRRRGSGICRCRRKGPVRPQRDRRPGGMG